MKIEFKWQVYENIIKELDEKYQSKWKAEKRFQYAENKSEDPMEEEYKDEEA